MNKKLISLLLALVMLSTSVIALATTPSKTTKDLVKVEKTVASDGSSIDALIWVKETPSDTAIAQFAEISTFTAQNQAVIDYYPEDTKTAIYHLLPTNTDPTTLIMSEFVDLGIGDYQTNFGDVTSTFSFATEFKPGQTVIAMVGYADLEGSIVWQALPVTAVDGMLQITFPSDLMIKMGHDAILSILSV